MRNIPHTPACSAQDEGDEAAAVETCVGGYKAGVLSVSPVAAADAPPQPLFMIVVGRALFERPPAPVALHSACRFMGAAKLLPRSSSRDLPLVFFAITSLVYAATCKVTTVAKQKANADITSCSGRPGRSAVTFLCRTKLAAQRCSVSFAPEPMAPVREAPHGVKA